jgi:hypothetical protein
MNRARIAAEQGDFDAAEAYVAEARACADAAGQVAVQADALMTSGLVELHRGRPDAAAGYLTGAIRCALECGQLLTLPELVDLLGVARLDGGEVAVAARLLGAGQAWRAARGVEPGTRLARGLIDAALQRLGEQPGARVLELEAERGARTPFGSLRGLGALDENLLSPVTDVRSATIDLRSAQSKAI